MQVLILAGGQGTRLRPLTHRVPKSMVPVAGKPFLEHQIDLLKRHGVSDVVLSLGYLGEQIRDFFTDGLSRGISIRYSMENEPLGTGGALKLAESLLEDEFCVVYGDSYLPLDYRGAFGHFLKSSKVACVVAIDIATVPVPVLPNLAIDEHGRVIDYQKDARDSRFRYVEAGVLFFKKTVFSFFPEQKSISLEKDIYPHLIDKNQLGAIITDKKFYDIGTPERLLTFEEFLK